MNSPTHNTNATNNTNTPNNPNNNGTSGAPLAATSTPVPDGFQEGTTQRPLTSADIRREASKPAQAQDFRKTVISGREGVADEAGASRDECRTRGAGAEFGEHRAQLRQHVSDSVQSVRGSAGNIYDDLCMVAGDVRQYARHNAGQAREYTGRAISANPWRAVALAGAVGVLLGALISRR